MSTLFNWIVNCDRNFWKSFTQFTLLLKPKEQLNSIEFWHTKIFYYIDIITTLYVVELIFLQIQHKYLPLSVDLISINVHRTIDKKEKHIKDKAISRWKRKSLYFNFYSYFVRYVLSHTINIYVFLLYCTNVCVRFWFFFFFHFLMSYKTHGDETRWNYVDIFMRRT